METQDAGPGRDTALIGRATECAVLDELVLAIQRGESRALVLGGEAGIGKTALIEHMVESAPDITVLRAVGVESEMELAYAGLHQMCGPLLDRLASLPAPQRRSLEIVFGLSDGAPPDRFLVGLGVLSLLAEASEERPQLCVIDDADWLDQASALTFVFVARRLVAAPVGIVFAARHPSGELSQLPRLAVPGLVARDSRALLGAAMRLKLDERVRDRIIAETQGNPLALLELPRELTSTELAGGFGPGAGHLSARLEESFSRRLDALSEDGWRLLLLAAAEPLGDPLLLHRASEQVGIVLAAIDVATETDGLLSLGAQVTFRHPLVRSAVYRSAAAPDRRAAHLALAQATDRETDSDRRAWHLAAAASGPDERVAAELEDSAGRAQARGGLVASAAFLQRALALTQDPTRRAERALAAAQTGLAAGAFEATLGHLATAQAGSLDHGQRARVDLVRGQVALARFDRDAAVLLLESAKRLESLNATLARDAYLDAWAAALMAGTFTGPASLRHVSEAARNAPPPPNPPRPSDQLLDALALLITEGRTAAASSLRSVTKLFARGRISADQGLRWGWLATVPPRVLMDDESWYSMLERLLELARGEGALAWLPLYLNQSATLMTAAGDFQRAASLIAETDAIAEATGTRLIRYGALMLAAFRGQATAASTPMLTTTHESSPSVQPYQGQYTRWVGAIVANGTGRYDDAMTSAAQASDDMPELLLPARALPELVEAACRGNHGRAAAHAVGRLAEITKACGTEWALGIEARCRALVSEGAAAEALYREAIDRLGHTRLRPELARTRLLYGEWLRRENRRSDARKQLHAAYDEFTTIGMEGFAERARMELLATGEKVRKRTVETRDELTAQERRIARLAHDGLSNAEIGGRLFLSPRTIEWHLRKVFTKLGIRSRRELMSTAAASESALLPT